MAGKPEYTCCNKDKKGSSIQCSDCEGWEHYACIGIPTPCKNDTNILSHPGIYYFCKACHKDNDEMSGSDIKNVIKGKRNDIKNLIGALETKVMSTIGNLKDELATISKLVDDTKNNMMEKIDVGNVKIEEKIEDTMQARAADIVHQPEGGAWTLAGSKGFKRKLARHESNTLIIKAKEGQFGDESYEEEMYKIVKSNLKDVKIDKMKFTRNKSVVLNLPDSVSIDKAKNALQDNDKVTANNTKKAHPKIMIPYVPLMELGDPASEDDKTEFVYSILNKNSKLNAFTTDDIKIINIRKAKLDKYRHVILKCSPKIRYAINQNNDEIYTTYGHYKVHDNYYVKICKFCQGYGHIEDECKKKGNGDRPICGKCAGNHKTDTCNCDRKDFKCSQCTRRNLNNDRNHAVFDYKCQAHKEQVRRIAENTEHGFQQ